MIKEHTYLADAPEPFVRTCDVLLKLDDGSELPAHSQILCRFSRVFANMLDDGPLSSASTLNKATLPLTHCSRATAISFLSMLYSPQHFEHIQKNRDSSMAMASLAHKLDMQVYPPIMRCHASEFRKNICGGRNNENHQMPPCRRL